MSSLIVTTGATVTFNDLIAYIVSYSFMKSIIDLNIKTLTIQYGNEKNADVHISRQFFEKCLAESEILQKFSLQLESEDDGIKVYKSKSNKFKLVAFPFSTSIEKFIEDSDIVISHAGTGAIIDTLRLFKPMIVVTNRKLMNDHQEEVANEFFNLNYCLKASSDNLKSDILLKQINDIKSNNVKFDALPFQDDSPIAGVIYKEISS